MADKEEWILSYPEPEDLPEVLSLSKNNKLEFLEDILNVFDIDKTNLILNQFKESLRDNKNILLENVIEEITNGKIKGDGKAYWREYNGGDIIISKA
tara:strand:- start:10481 stop:10771 length:291 start_codon:yes stop_codon:yes gene_type:complete